jgi:SAM-dependent methyltransferase
MHHFDDIRSAYQRSYRQHGDSPASLLCPKGRQHLRFSAIAPFAMNGRMSVLDYGCGLGHMLDYLLENGVDVDYHGVDIVPDFVDACREKHGDAARFDVIDPENAVEGSYDVVFASGVFNLKSSQDDRASRDYAFERIENLFGVSRRALICDFLTGYVDFQQGDAQHFSVSEISDFCVSSLTRRFVVRHDLLPYEFTLVAFSDDEILRPDNVYKASGHGAVES